MRRVVLGLVALVAIVIASSGVASACDITNGKFHCGGGCIDLTWDTLVTPECQVSNVIIERKCGAGAYAVIAEGSYDGAYSDCSGAGCISGWTYKVTIECSCSSTDYVIIGPETCP